MSAASDSLMRTRVYTTPLGTVVRQTLGWDVQHRQRVEHIELCSLPLPRMAAASPDAKEASSCPKN